MPRNVVSYWGVACLWAWLLNGSGLLGRGSFVRRGLFVGVVVDGMLGHAFLI